MSETTEQTEGAVGAADVKEHGYLGLLPEHKEFMSIGPKDCTWHKPEDIAFHVQVQRQTNMTGEQMAIQVPVFIHDDCDAMMKRINLAFSIPQKRLEDENKAMLLMKSKQDTALKMQADEEARLKILKAQEKMASKLEKRGKLHLQGVQQ